MNATKDDISATYEQALRQYFDNCRARVPLYVKTYLQYPGAIKTNSRALGLDMLRSPLNLFWSPVYLLLISTAFILGKLKLKRLSHWLAKTPAGLTTNVQAFIAGKIKTELLQIQNFETDANTFMAQEFSENHSPASNANAPEHMEPLIESSLREYVMTRTASADITNSLTTTIVGALAWKKLTLGAFAIGFLIAMEINHYLSVENFIFGSTLGDVYYRVFPDEPSTDLKVIGVALALTFMAIFAPLSGFISDPVQSALGLHQRRLRKMINALESDVLQNNNSRYKPKDQYLARLADTIDAVRSPLI